MYRFVAVFVFYLLIGIANTAVQVSNTITLPTTLCESTQNGKYFVTDSNGKKCSREFFDSATGCCRNGDAFTCEGCGEDQCCDLYETCVSCCLSPKNSPDEKYRNAFRIREKSNFGKWENPFRYCQGICRTWRKSTVHENAFIDTRRFCFSEFGRPSVDEPPLPEIPSNVKVISGKLGEDCSQVCERNSGTCESEAFPSIFSCNFLRKYFICAAGCGEIEDDSKSEPYYITTQTEKRNFPAYCVANSASKGSTDGCLWKEANAYRLCPCNVQSRS